MPLALEDITISTVACSLLASSKLSCGVTMSSVVVADGVRVRDDIDQGGCAVDVTTSVDSMTSTVDRMAFGVD